MNLGQFTLNPRRFDWPMLLSWWRWLLPEPVTPTMVSRLGDLVIVNQDGTVFFLDIGRGRLSQIASSPDEFNRLIVEDRNATEWLGLPVVKQLIKRGLRFKEYDESIYGLKILPLYGGNYDPSNFEIADMYSQFCLLGRTFDEWGNVHSKRSYENRFSKQPDPPN